MLASIGDSIAVPIDVSGINHRTTRKIEIPVEEGLSIKPESVSVEITPVLQTSSSSSASTSIGHKKIQVRVEVFHLLIQERNHRQQPFLPVRNLGQAARPQVQKKHQKQANQHK